LKKKCACAHFADKETKKKRTGLKRPCRQRGTFTVNGHKVTNGIALTGRGSKTATQMPGMKDTLEHGTNQRRRRYVKNTLIAYKKRKAPEGT